MNKQPTKPITTWEMLTDKLLSIYAKSLIEMERPVEPMESAQLRADVRSEIIAIGKLLDDTEKAHANLLKEHEEQEFTVAKKCLEKAAEELFREA